MFESLIQNGAADKSPSLWSAPDTAERRRAQAWLRSRLERGRREPFAEVVTITPVLAELLLANNPSNRRISPTGLKRLIADAKEGAWDLNGETIKVAKTGELNDGQHRCELSVITGRSFESFIVFGVERATRRTVDRGIKRPIGGQLQMAGYKDGNNLGHAARIVWQYHNLGRISRNPEDAPTSQQIFATIENNPRLLDSAGADYKCRSLRRRGLMWGLHFLFAEYDRAKADTFFERLGTGLGFSGKNDPAYRFREQLVEAASRKARTFEPDVAARAIKAFNLFCKGRTCRQLSWRSGGDSAEPFPQIGE